MMLPGYLVVAVAALLAVAPRAAIAEPAQAMAAIPEGDYLPFFPEKTGTAGQNALPAHVGSFQMDVEPVTNRRFLAFVRTHPSWRKSRVKAVFADSHYLDSWPSDLHYGTAREADVPVTNVSWFAAKAYCEAQGKALPTTDQWEYVLADQGRDRDRVTSQTLAWYGNANLAHIPPVESASKNGFGIAGLVGQVWEWTLDFNSFMLSSELRNGGGNERALFCGAGGADASDATDYAAFMRYAMRSSLQANYTTKNLGFRCVQEVP